MRHFSYKALDASRKAVEGEAHVETQRDLDLYFRERNLLPLKVAEKKEDQFKLLAKRIALRWNKKQLERDLIAFTRQFAAAYGAGLPIGRTLDILAREAQNAQFKSAIVTIGDNIKAGRGLVDCFGQFPEFFDNTYRALLTSGEMTGNLDTVLNYSAGLLEKKAAHDERISSTLLYPKIVMVTIGLTIIVVLTFVIPQFKKIFDKFGAELPLPTQIMMGASEYFQAYWGWSFVIIPGLIFLWEWAKRKEAFMLWFDERTLEFPVLGLALQRAELTHFCTTFALMLRAGVRITDATRIAINAMRNTFLREQLRKIIPIVEQGGTLAQALNDMKGIPALMGSMVAIGEESGTLDLLLDRVAALYETETEVLLKKLPTFLEPIILSFLFAMVLFIALAVYLPMWKMSALIKK